jgi:putative membrane protein
MDHWTGGRTMRDMGMRVAGALALAAAMMAGGAARADAQTSDAGILGEQAAGNRGEVMIATWVAAHAHRPAVRSYANTLVRDHRAGLRQVQATARRIHVTPDAAAGAEATRKANDALNMLKSKHGAEMDAAFVQHSVDDHREDIAEAQKARGEAHSAAVKTLLANTLPVLRRHLRLAEALQPASARH